MKYNRRKVRLFIRRYNLKFWFYIAPGFILALIALIFLVVDMVNNQW